MKKYKLHTVPKLFKLKEECTNQLGDFSQFPGEWMTELESLQVHIECGQY